MRERQKASALFFIVHFSFYIFFFFLFDFIYLLVFFYFYVFLFFLKVTKPYLAVETIKK